MSTSTKIKALFYGSLRKGEYNHNRFVEMYGSDNFVYKGTKTIQGWELYSLGPYPTILKGSEESQLVVDEFELSPEAFRSVRGMEIGAGYQEAEIDGAFIYHYSEEDREYLGRQITHGDWSKYLGSKED